jgi:hypothetical protein
MTASIYVIDYANISKHYLYDTWSMIKQRCFNPKCKIFKYYGGSGITLFPDWVNDSRAFLKWIDANLRNSTR